MLCSALGRQYEAQRQQHSQILRGFSQWHRLPAEQGGTAVDHSRKWDTGGSDGPLVHSKELLSGLLSATVSQMSPPLSSLAAERQLERYRCK